MTDTSQKTITQSAPTRITSMDQLRGYAIFGMIFVNYAGRFDITPWMLKHHRLGMSYNDTIAPLFIFVVGMGFRLSMLRRIAAVGPARARWAAARRYALLTLLGGVIYMGYLWDALTDIGIAGLLTLFLIDARPVARIIAAFSFLAFFQWVYAGSRYGEWVLQHSLNGGPLGPLSWAFVLLMGTLAYDLITASDSRVIMRGCLTWGFGLSITGWLLRAPWPGVKAEWPFTQYGMSAPYPLFATGLCFLTLLAFHYLCDIRKLRLPHLTMLGENPLVLYLAQGAILLLIGLVLPSNVSLAVIMPGFLAAYGLCYGLAWWLHRRHSIVKL